VEQLKPDVLLLDVEMPRLNGIQVAVQLRNQGSPVHTLVLSAYEDRHHILGMLNNGVAGYLTKEEVPDTLVRAVRDIASGQRGWVSQRLAEKLSAWRIQPRDSFFLSPDQRELLRLMAKNKDTAVVARLMGQPEQSVQKDIEDLCRQLGAQSITELLRMAQREALV
jgi:DNA-binding NarL/FixJ family response regulator